MANYGGGGGGGTRRARARGRRARHGGGDPYALIFGPQRGAQPSPPPATPPPATPPPVAAEPDYNQLIHDNPAYQSWAASANQRRGNLATNRAAAIRQLMLQYGGMPAGFKDAYGDMRPEDIAASQGNQFSVERGLERNYKQGVESMHRSLASRGMLESGDLGYGQQQADLAHGQAESDAAQAFLASLNQAISGYAGGMSDIGAEESGVIAGILPLIEQLYPHGAGDEPAGGGAAAQAHAVPSGQDWFTQFRHAHQHRGARARRGGYRP